MSTKDISGGSSASSAAQLFKTLQSKEAEAAKAAKNDPGANYKDNKGVVEKDSLALATEFKHKTSDELNKLYETHNTDGVEGLNETEFEALFKAVVEDPAAKTQATSETKAKDESTATVTKDGETKTVTVKPGDTLSKIARENGVTLEQLKEANPHLFKEGKDDAGKKRSAGGNLIYPGDQVKIPQKPKADETKTEEGKKTDEGKKTEETKKDESKSEDAKADKALKTINETKLTNVPPQLPEEDKKAIQEGNQKKVKDAQKALEDIPADHPKRTEAEKKVAKLEEQYKTQYGESANPEKDVKNAKATIDDAKIKGVSPADLNRLTPDQLKEIQAGDQKTLDKAKAALEQIPADDPQRAKYEEKVKALEGKFTEAYGKTEIKVDEGIDDNEARRMVSSRSPEELDKLDIGTRLGIIKALDKGATSYAEYQAIGETAKSIARTNPDALTPDVVKQMGDDGIREFMKDLPADQLGKIPGQTRGAMIQRLEQGETTPEEDKLIGQLALSMAKTAPESLTPDIVKSMDDNGVREFLKEATDADLAKLPAGTRTAMMQELIDGATSDEEDKMIGRLAASLAETNPEALTADVVRGMDDNGVRALMDHLDAKGLEKLPAETRTAMIQQLVEGATSDEEDALIGRIAVSMAATAPEALTPELIRSMDDNGVREMTKDMSVADLSKLRRAALEAMREELRAGWTTDFEYQQIDKITQALPNAK